MIFFYFAKVVYKIVVTQCYKRISYQIPTKTNSFVIQNKHLSFCLTWILKTFEWITKFSRQNIFIYFSTRIFNFKNIKIAILMVLNRESIKIETEKICKSYFLGSLIVSTNLLSK